MPVSRPGTLYRWATAVGALITAPSSGRQDTGWVAEEPPADIWNAVWLNTYQWLAYLQDLANQAFTWTGAHQFDGAIGGNDTASTAQLNRLRAKNLLKAWANVTTNGSGGVTLVDGFNVSGVALVGGIVKVTFAQQMADVNYAADVQSAVVATKVRYVGAPYAKNQAWVEVTLGDLAGLGGGGASTVALDTTATAFDVFVYGRQ